jgi:hypothetical protein
MRMKKNFDGSGRTMTGDTVVTKYEVHETKDELILFHCWFVLQGLLKWLLKRVRSRIPFDGNKLYAGEMLAILLQETVENRVALGEMDGIDVVLQQLATFKRHDPTSNEEGEYMENLFNCLCSALLHGSNRDKFLKGEGPQLMNLMLRYKNVFFSLVINRAVS